MKEYSKLEGRKMCGVSRLVVFGTAAAMLVLSGCKSEEEYREDRISNAKEQYKKIRQEELPADKVLTLQDCIDLAMKYNLDVRVQNMEKDAAENLMWAEMLGMLPDLSVTDNFTTRSNEPGSRSRSVKDGGAGTFDYSTSQDRTINNFSVDLAFSLLDFGLAFFNTQQSHDRVLLKDRQIDRLRQNLKLDVVRAYFKVASAQRAVDITQNLLNECKQREKMIDDLQKNKKITPFRAFEEKNRLLTMERRLSNYTRIYENSCVELRSLLGRYPTVNIIVDDTILDQPRSMDLPDIELLEQMAILKRPELFEIDIQRHINILECRKTLVMMLPNVQLYMDLVNNNNSFLYYQTWWELAIRAAYNALKTPQYLARYMSYSDQADVEKMRAFAQAITVMSQVRIAKADIASSQERYEINRREFELYNGHLKKEQERKKVRGSVSELDINYLRMSVAEMEIERLLAQGSCHIAYYRLLNAIGVENLDPKTQDELKAELAKGAEAAKKEMTAAREEYEKMQEDAEKARIARMLFDEGMKKENANQLLAASEYYRRSAQEGNASAMFCLGKMYWTGNGVPADYQKAVKCFRDAAEHGNVDAMVTLGFIYYRGMHVEKNLSQARKYYQMAADNGDDRSYYWLGMISYDQGDYQDSLDYFKKAARVKPEGAVFSSKVDEERKSIEETRGQAMVRIGCIYREGKSKEGVDNKKAIEWFELAEKANCPEAKSNLGIMYAGGLGVPADAAKADKYFREYEEAKAQKQ